MLSRPIAYSLLVLPWAIALAALAWLVALRFPPSGSVSFDVPFDGSSAWVDPFQPSERVTSPGRQQDGWTGQRIFQDPVYATARLPGVYEVVEMEVEFRPLRQPLVELGVLRDPNDAPAGAASGRPTDGGTSREVKSYDFQPLWFAPLETDAWRAAAGGQRRGFVRRTGTVAILSSSDFDKLAVWHASATAFRDSDPAGPAKRLAVSLRGTHDFWAIPAAGRLSFSFDLQDVNRAAGPDQLIVRVSRDGEELMREVISLGGSRDHGMGPVIKKTVELDRAVPGVYRIQFSANDDIFIRGIETTSRRWVIGPRLAFGDTVGFATSSWPGIAWSNSRHLVLQTLHREGLQRVAFGSTGLSLTRTHDLFNLARTSGGAQPEKFMAPAGDVRIIGDGWFALAPNAFFTPQPRRVTDAMDPAAEGIAAVLTPYERPRPLAGGWYVARARFALDPSQDRIRLALSVPNIFTRAGAVDIRRMRLTYRRPPLSWSEWWRVIRQEAVNAWKRYAR